MLAQDRTDTEGKELQGRENGLSDRYVRAWSPSE